MSIMEDNDLSEYELLRERNIAEFKKLFKEQFGEELRVNPSSDKSIQHTHAARIRRTSSKKLINGPIRRSPRISFRYQSEENSDDSDYETNGFKGFKSLNYSVKKLEMFELNRQRAVVTRKKINNAMPKVSLRCSRHIPTPDEITVSDIENIHYSSSQKTYDSVGGTTCHQCRQKTIDRKTVCRNKECIGIRGQFCGFCLKARYGEDVATALKDPEWSCPPCRKICNCSICRTRLGKNPTGILVPLALEKGYTSVKDFLEKFD